MRSTLFNIAFAITSIVFGLLCALLSLLPGRKPLMLGLSAYTHTMMFLMRFVADIKVKVSGHENLPETGPYIIAAKHQSYGDGFVLFSQFFDLSFVTGDHLEKFALMKKVLAKAGAVVIRSCGGSDVRDKLQKESERVRDEGRRILIFPEGHLSKVGTHHRYRKGVFFMYQDFDCPVIPVATNLGQRWNQNDWKKFPGPAHIEFLEPIPPGLGKEEFMKILQDRIETRSIEILDRENLGALNINDIGKISENSEAKASREAREASETEQPSTTP